MSVNNINNNRVPVLPNNSKKEKPKQGIETEQLDSAKTKRVIFFENYRNRFVNKNDDLGRNLIYKISKLIHRFYDFCKVKKTEKTELEKIDIKALGGFSTPLHELNYASNNFLILINEINEPQVSKEEKVEKTKRFFNDLKSIAKNDNPHIQSILSVFELMQEIIISHSYSELNSYESIPEIENGRFLTLVNTFKTFLRERFDNINKNIAMIFNLSFTFKASMKQAQDDIKNYGHSDDFDSLLDDQENKLSKEDLKNCNSDISEFIKLMTNELQEKFRAIASLVILIVNLYKEQSQPLNSFCNYTDKSISQNINNFIKHKDMLEKSFNLFQKYEESLLSEINGLKKQIKLMSNYYLFFKLTPINHISKKIKDSNNFSELYDNFTSEIIIFSEEYKKNKTLQIDAFKVLKDKKEFFLERCIFNKLYDQITEVVAIFKGFSYGSFFRIFDLFHILANHKDVQSHELQQQRQQEIQSLHIKGEKKTKSSSHSKPVQSVHHQKSTQSSSPKGEKEEVVDEVISPSNLDAKQEVVECQEIKLSSTEMVVKILNQIKKCMTKAGVPALSAFGAKESYQNCRNHSLSLFSLMHKFLRCIQAPITSIEIGEFIIRLVIHGTLALEGFYLTHAAQNNNVKNAKDLKALKSHDLLLLLDNCSFSKGKTPTFEEWKNVKGTNNGEIPSRGIHKYQANFDPKKPAEEADALHMLVKAYLFAKGDPRINLQTLLKEAVTYFCTIQKTIHDQMRLFSALTQKENTPEFKGLLSKLTSHFGEACQNIKLEDAVSNEKIFGEVKIVLEKLKPIVQAKSLSIQDSFAIIEFQVACLEAELNSYSPEFPKEISLVCPRILQLNQFIVEEFCYLLLKLQGNYQNRIEIDHDLVKLVNLLGCKLEDFTPEEQEFLQNEKKVLSFTRYATDANDDSILAQTTQASRKLAKSHVTGTKAIEMHDQIYEVLIANIATMRSILSKLYNSLVSQP